MKINAIVFRKKSYKRSSYKKKANQRKIPRAFSSERRIIFLFVIFSLFGGVVLARFFDLQIRQYSIFFTKAKAQHSIRQVLLPKRGEILMKDKNGSLYPIAANKDVAYVYAAPQEISKSEQTAKALSEILDLPEKQILFKLQKPNDPYEVIKNKVSDEESEKIKNFGLKGVYMGYNEGRTYPLKELAGHLSGFVGFVGDTRVGQYGLEGFYNQNLEGLSGMFSGEGDILGRWLAVADRVVEPPKNGADLILTIDPNVQSFVHAKLKAAMEKWESPTGSVIVADPKTGAILAMSSIPSFDPNDYSVVDDFKKFINPVVSDLFEPGSIMKPLTMAAAVDAGVIGPDSEYEDKGVVKIGGYAIRNFDNKAYGVKTMTEVLELSLNTGAVYAVQKMDKSEFLEYLTKFGFSETTGIDLTGEAVGNIGNLAYKRDINFATASFGQGIAVTPIEMISAFGTIANGGKLMKPYVVDRIVAEDKVIFETEPIEKRAVISKQTSKTVRDMLVSVGKSKFYQRAAVPGYSFAAKTGTAQIPGENGGYSDEVIHSFIGFFPAYDPKFIVMIKIDKPKGNRFASNTLSSVFRETMGYLLNYYQIPPDDK